MATGALNRPVPERMALAGATLLAVLCPIVLFWPSEYIERPRPPSRLTRFGAPPAVALQGTVFDAPLFNAERSAQPAGDQAEIQAAAAALVAPPPQLVGTIAGRAGDSVALIKDSGGEAHTLRIGEDVDGWRLVSIGNGTATLDRAGDRQTVALDFSNRKVSANTASAPLQPAPSPQAASAQPAAYPQYVKPALRGITGQQ